MEVLRTPSLEHFRVERNSYKKDETVIGKGVFGVVYSGHMKGRTVAIKELKLGDKFCAETFLREIITPASFTHPAILQIVGFVEPTDTQGPAIITPYMAYGSLATLNKQRIAGELPYGWDPNRLAVAFYGIADALRLLHANGFIHRDVKPSNILFMIEHRAHLSDFGTAKCIKRDKDGNIPPAFPTLGVGTPFYRAPEMLVADSQDQERQIYDEKVDVYAFGMTVFESLCSEGVNNIHWEDGERFDKNNKTMLTRKILEGKRFKRRDEITDAYWELITGCWSHNPMERPSSAEIVEMMKSDRFALHKPPRRRASVFRVDQRRVMTMSPEEMYLASIKKYQTGTEAYNQAVGDLMAYTAAYKGQGRL